MKAKDRLIIRINDSFYVEADDNNYIVKEIKITKEGKEREEILGYYGSMEKALMALMKIDRLFIDNVDSLDEYIDAIRAQDDKCLEGIRAALGGLKDGRVF